MSGFGDEELPGFIFMCNSNTKPQCFQYRVFGLPLVRLKTAMKIKFGAKLFLYDFQVKLLYGIYEATSSGHLNIQPDAFNGSFPSQVSFRIYKDCLPLPENIFKDVIHESYDGPKFKQELTSWQVKALMELFQPIHVEPTYSRELHQQSTSYRRPSPHPQSLYYSGTQQTGQGQDSAYFYNQFGRQIPRYYGTQVAVPYSETRNINVHPPHFPVNDPNERVVSAYFHGNQPSHHAIAAQPHHNFDGSRMFDPNGRVVNAYFHGNQSPHHAIAAAAQPHQGYANPPMQHTFYQSSPYYHYNPVAYAVPHQGDVTRPRHGHVSTNQASYYAHGAPYHPQYSGHQVVATYQPNNDNRMYQQQQPPSYNHQHHGSAAAVGGQLQVYEHGNNVPPTQAEPNLPASKTEKSCSDSN